MTIAVTEKERAMLRAIRSAADQFCGDEQDSMWTDLIIDYAPADIAKVIGNGRSRSGLISSLSKKKLVVTDMVENPNTSGECVFLTDEGLAIAKEEDQ